MRRPNFILAEVVLSGALPDEKSIKKGVTLFGAKCEIYFYYKIDFSESSWLIYQETQFGKNPIVNYSLLWLCSRSRTNRAVTTILHYSCFLTSCQKQHKESWLQPSFFPRKKREIRTIFVRISVVHAKKRRRPLGEPSESKLRCLHRITCYTISREKLSVVL